MPENTENFSEESRTGNSYLIPGAIIVAGFLIASAVVYTSFNRSVPRDKTAAVAGDEKKRTNAGSIVDDDPFLGSPEAPVTIVEFGDFQCPFCKRFFETTEREIIDTYVKTGKVRFVYRDFPITSIHPMAQKSAEASECADDQNKFWEYHDLLYQRQGDLGNENLKRWARELGLNGATFDECLDSGKYKNEVERDYADGIALGVSGTPANIVNGRLVPGALPFEQFRAIIEAELAR